MKRMTLALIMALLFSAAAGNCLFSMSYAQPYIHGGIVPPKPDEIPPSVSLFHPENKTSYNTTDITLVFNVNLTAKGEYIAEVTYTGDWLQNAEYAYRNYPYPTDYSSSKDFSLSLTEIPEGSHFIVVNATELGGFIESKDVGWPIEYWYFISGYSSVYFAIDLTSPNVSVLSLENRVFDVCDVPLKVAVSEPVSQILYSLDGQEKVKIFENATLVGLSSGEHNVAVYVTDLASNVGVSEIIYFTVIEPFPTTLVLASVITVAIVIMSLRVYFKKRKVGSGI